jgi:hypothetical protein
MILLAVIVFAGYLFPPAGAIMSWREWRAIKRVPPLSVWRRETTLIALLLFTAAVPLWVYAVIREWTNNYSYVCASAHFGRWSSLTLVVLSAFAEHKVRWYLLLGALGLLFFYGGSIGELP